MRPTSIAAALAGAALMIATAAGVCQADGIIIPEPPPGVPIEEADDLAIRYHRVNVKIEGQVATTEIDQVFVNHSEHDLEGIYIFPLPQDASISEFAMYVDGERLEGQLLERAEARGIYEAIVRQRLDPALLEYADRGAFRARVFPIPENGEKRVQLEYRQVLQIQEGLAHYSYPLDTERFSSRPIEEVAISVTLDAGAPLKAVYSPSHDVLVERKGEGSAEVTYEEVDSLPDRDFELYYSMSADEMGLNVLSYRVGDDDGFFLMMVTPPFEAQAHEVVAKDVIVVLDTSGSMEGDKLLQAKGALGFILDHLNEMDRFNVVAFSSATRSYASELRPASERAEARTFVERLEAVGGTDINRALLEALSGATGERPTVLIFLTDGQATNGVTETEAILRNVEREARDRGARIFTFGIGDDVNTILLDRLAQDNRGTSAYVRPHQSVEEVVSGFYAQITRPVLVDLSLDFGDARVEDVYPYPLPDLFEGAQLLVAGRYVGGGEAAITLRGSIDEEERDYVYEQVALATKGGPDFIPRLWATRKIGYLLDQIRLHGEESELVEEIVDLSIRHGVLTPYTSFLVEEDERGFSDELREEAAMQVAPAEEPAMGSEAVEGSVARGALKVAGRAQVDTAEIRHVADKSFVVRDGVWVDTAFDGVMPTSRLRFASDDYFRLLRARPDWGKYLSVGPSLIVVLEGVAYEVSEGGASDAAIPPPPTVTPPATAVPAEAHDPGSPEVSVPFWERLWAWLNPAALAREWMG